MKKKIINKSEIITEINKDTINLNQIYEVESSEEGNSEKKSKVLRVIKQDAIMQIDVSFHFYNRINYLLSFLVANEEDPEKTIVNITDWQSGGSLTTNEMIIQSYMILLKSIEEVAMSDFEKYTEFMSVPDSFDLSKEMIVPNDFNVTGNPV